MDCQDTSARSEERRALPLLVVASTSAAAAAGEPSSAASAVEKGSTCLLVRGSGKERRMRRGRARGWRGCATSKSWAGQEP